MQPSDQGKIYQLLKYFDIDSAQIEILEEEEQTRITLNMSEEEAGRLIGRFATTLDSLQLIITLMLNKGATHRSVLLDVAGYRARRLDTLTTLVENAKQQALNSGLPCVLPPLSSTERRQVHIMIKDDEQFTSYSEGYGQDRRLFIATQTL